MQDVDWCDVPPANAAVPRRYTYYVGKHHAASKSPLGRGTKGYVAFDVDRDRLVFIKDYWCALADGVHRELNIYRRLHENGVSHVPTALAGGDVGGPEMQTTVTQDFMKEDEEGRVPAKRVHYILVTKEVGRLLETYRGQLELNTCLFHAFTGEYVSESNSLNTLTNDYRVRS